jgi:hypothetical protein
MIFKTKYRLIEVTHPFKGTHYLVEHKDTIFGIPFCTITEMHTSLYTAQREYNLLSGKTPIKYKQIEP